MRTGESLDMHEEIMLLALRDAKGTVFGDAMYAFAVGGAVLVACIMPAIIASTTAAR